MPWVWLHAHCTTAGRWGSFACASHILHLSFMHCSLLKDTAEPLGIIREDEAAWPSIKYLFPCILHLDYLKILSLIVLFWSQSRAVLLDPALALHCYSYLSFLWIKALVRTGADCTGDPVDTNKRTWSFCCCRFTEYKHQQMEHGKRGHNVQSK